MAQSPLSINKKGKHYLKNSEGSQSLRETQRITAPFNSFSILFPLAFQCRDTLSGGNPCAHRNHSCLPFLSLQSITFYHSDVQMSSLIFELHTIFPENVPGMPLLKAHYDSAFCINHGIGKMFSLPIQSPWHATKKSIPATPRSIRLFFPPVPKFDRWVPPTSDSPLGSDVFP